MNCSEIRSVTSSLFIHRLFAFCRHSPQLILRLYYVSSRPSAVGKLRRTVADQPGVDWFGQHLGVSQDLSGDTYRVARRPCGRPALSELGVKVSLHPAQALRTPP